MENEYRDVCRICPIPDYSGYYASEDGEIYSIRSGVGFSKLSKRNHKGYFRVHLQNNQNARVSLPVHALILNAFVGPRPFGYVCRHLNGDRHDNRLINLCWGTPKENVQDTIKHGTASCLRHGEESSAAKLRLKDIKIIKKLYSKGLKQKDIAEIFSVSQRHVSSIVNNQTWCKDQ